MKKAIIGTMLGITGIALVAWDAGWLSALGVFLAIWGNNAEGGAA